MPFRPDPQLHPSPLRKQGSKKATGWVFGRKQLKIIYPDFHLALAP